MDDTDADCCDTDLFTEHVLILENSSYKEILLTACYSPAPNFIQKYHSFCIRDEVYIFNKDTFLRNLPLLI